ncbi:hypothetical protein T11_6933 [Trichinella zimbabwensis]|uniref:Uncharacterized protein n=1 Tax=Trichinella zimbabwensis TaxID=268475 RepID=A0A0V1I984_9BILA|nr:hypothetical protein T11_6933 [Trichinella zimbabwensis]
MLISAIVSDRRSSSPSVAGSAIRNLRTSLVHTPLSALTITVQIAPSFPRNVSTTLPIGHLLAGTPSSENMLEIQHNVIDLWVWFFNCPLGSS